MAPFREHFPTRERVLLAVIHTMTEEASVRSVDTAFEAGADGVFLINQTMVSGDVIRLAESLRARLGEKPWMGINLLGYQVDLLVASYGHLFQGIWSDRYTLAPSLHDAGHEEFELRMRGLLWFGGVCFKYTNAEHYRGEALAVEVSCAKGYGVDVITTSGAETGVGASLGKVEEVVAASEDHPVALASGVSSENVDEYMRLGVKAFIVASSIEKSFGVLDGVRTKALADRIHGGAG